jgi:hypothetical protein
MRRAIIHIGMPRTGSTTFQWAMVGLRPDLMDAGILYPDLTPASARATPHINHQHFGETLDGRRPRRERKDMLEALSTQLKRWDGDVVLLSYEDFIQQQPRFRIPELFRDFFARHGFAAEAMVAVKPQSEHLNSIYTHRAQMISERRHFGQFAPCFAGSGRFEYDALIRPWIKAFSGRVRAVAVRDRRSDAPILPRLLTELELDDRVIPLLRRADLARVANRSPGPLAVEVSRRLRSLRTHVHLSVLPRNMMRFVERLAREWGFDSQRFQGVDPDMRTRMAADYRDVNERFAQAVWGRGWDEIVVPERSRPINELATCGIGQDAEEAIREILHRAARQFDVQLRHSVLNTPINRLVESVDAAQRLLGYSRWRVL